MNPDRTDRPPEIARARYRLRRRQRVLAAVRTAARVFAVGRSARARAGAGSAPAGQARSRHQRASSRSAITRSSRRSRTATTPACSRGTTCTSWAASRPRCGRITWSACMLPASTATAGASRARCCPAPDRRAAATSIDRKPWPIRRNATIAFRLRCRIPVRRESGRAFARSARTSVAPRNDDACIMQPVQTASPL